MNGVLVMAYGTPRRREDVAAYYTDIRRGRAPSEEQLADLIRRYDAIGGLSPLAERTEAQRAAIAAFLDDSAPGGYRVEVGLRHAEPTIEQAVTTLVGAGVDHVTGLVLAPHYSSMSVRVYLDRAAGAAAARGVGFDGIASWGTEPALVDYLAGEVAAGLRTMPASTRVVFTAHSLPRRILDSDDPYPDEIVATARAVAERAGLADHRWFVAWQSAGRTAEPWLGPDILEVIDAVAAEGHRDGLLVCPCGFTADHLEVLYDLDIEAAQRAEERGIAFARTAVVNDDPAVMAALARRIAGR